MDFMYISSQKDFIDILSAIGIPILLIYIAIRQWKTSEDSRKQVLLKEQIFLLKRLRRAHEIIGLIKLIIEKPTPKQEHINFFAKENGISDLSWDISNSKIDETYKNNIFHIMSRTNEYRTLS